MQTMPAFTDDAPAVLIADQPRCDRDCDKPAVFGYVWAWGETGTCCAVHSALLQQTSTQLERSIQFHPLVQASAAPLTRDERTQLKATSLVLAEELEESKQRGLELYRLNNELIRSNNGLTIREREARAQLVDREADVARLEQKVLERDQEHGELVAEIERLKVVESLVNAPEASSALWDEDKQRMTDEINELKRRLGEQPTEQQNQAAGVNTVQG